MSYYYKPSPSFIVSIWTIMGIIASNSYLAVFSLGTFIGASSVYFILRLRFSPKWQDGMEERFEVNVPFIIKNLNVILFFFSLKILRMNIDLS